MCFKVAEDLCRQGGRAGGRKIPERTEPRRLGAGLSVPQGERHTFPTGREGVGRMQTLIFELGGSVAWGGHVTWPWAPPEQRTQPSAEKGGGWGAKSEVRWFPVGNAKKSMVE